MAEPDYYGLIGVAPTATIAEIRAQFRTRVLADHPDKGGDPVKFQLLNKAYNILVDAEKRRNYDRTGRSEKSAEEQFVEGFGGGRNVPRSKDLDREAVVNLEERAAKASGAHDAEFAEWLRQRDQSEMVLTDKDFMKTALYNAAEMSTKIRYEGPVHNVLGSPKTDAYGQHMAGPVLVQCKPRPIKKTLDHDEVLVRMLAVPVDDSMVYAELSKGGVPLGMTGVGRIEQVGSRIDGLKQEDAVLVMPKPTKFSQQKPIGTARTLLFCGEEDILRIPGEILEELTPEQISLTPTIVCAYILLEQYGKNLKPGDSVLLNAAHFSACGSALLQLCKLLKLKPICLLQLPGAPKHLVKGEYGSKGAWQDADSRAVAPPNVRTLYDRISEWLTSMGAEEVFPDSVALLRWRDRNQRMLPKLALDGIATRESAEQLIHCLQSGEKDAQVVVYGHGVAQPIELSPPLLVAWGGRIVGFNIARWVHSLSGNAKKMMLVMENVTKLVRANKFSLDTVLYKVGEDIISDAFTKAADSSDRAQVVLVFPTLEEENRLSGNSIGGTSQPQIHNNANQKEGDDRDKLKEEWLANLFTAQSVAASSPEGPLPITLNAGKKASPSSLIVWIGDQHVAENEQLKSLGATLASSAFISLAWSQHPAGEGLETIDLTTPEVCKGSWYMKDRTMFENEALDTLHDVEILGRSLSETIESKLSEYGLEWKNVIIVGFGKGAGIAMYASLLKIFPQQVSSMVLFSPIVMYPRFLESKINTAKRSSTAMKIFTVWGGNNRSTPTIYKDLITNVLRKVPDVQATPDTILEAAHSFDAKSLRHLQSVLPLCLPR